MNIINNQKFSYIELIKDELKEENNENESDSDNEVKNINNTDYTQTMKYKESGLTLESKNTLINQTPKIKTNKINLHKTSTFNANNNNNHSNKLKEKIKFSPNEKKENNDITKKLKNSQKIMHNIFTLHDENNKNNDKNYLKAKTNSNFISNKLKKENSKNTKSKISPFNLNKDKKQPIRVTSSLTSTNINKLVKKKKKSQDEAKR